MLTVQNLGHPLLNSFQCNYCRTYSTLASGVKGRTRLQQVVDWVGGKNFEGALVFDECGRQRGCVWGGVRCMGMHGRTKTAAYLRTTVTHVVTYHLVCRSQRSGVETCFPKRIPTASNGR